MLCDWILNLGSCHASFMCLKGRQLPILDYILVFWMKKTVIVDVVIVT
jgi:hypothetical protein